MAAFVCGKVTQQLSRRIPALLRNNIVIYTNISRHNVIQKTDVGGIRQYQFTYSLLKKSNVPQSLGTKPAKVKQPTNVCLLDIDESELGVMTKDEAQKVAEERDVKLVLLNAETLNPTYQLMTGKQLAQMRQTARKDQNKSKKKDIKTLVLKSSITGHDLDNKTKGVLTWLEKEHQIRITIKSSSRSTQPMNRILQHINELVKDVGRVAQARCTEYEMRLDVYPLKKQGKGQGGAVYIKPLSINELKELKNSQQKPDDS